MKKLLPIFLIILLSINAETLFEVKDSQDSTVFSISDDGMRVFNDGDTLMVISTSEIKAFIDNSKDRALSRSFSISTNTTGKDGLANVLEVTTNQTTMREGTGGDQYTDFSPQNIFLGLNAGTNISTGVNNVFVGNYSGLLNGEGDNNVFIGDSTGISNSSGWKNIFLGNNSGKSNTTGYANVFIGNNAGINNIAGGSNVFIGSEAGSKNSLTRYWNTYVGTAAGMEATGDANAFFGYGSGLNSSGGKNSFFGYNSGFKNKSGENNSMFGNSSGLQNVAGSSNCVFGYEAGYGIYDNSDYNFNCLFGASSGKSLTTGSENVFIGYEAGSSISTGHNNTFLGRGVGGNNQEGVGNVFIGYYAGFNEMGSNKLYIDNGITSTPLIYGDFGTNVLQINGVMNIPSLYTTTSLNSTKVVYVDINGKLCVAAKSSNDLPENGDIDLLKEENKRLKTEIENLRSQIEEIKIQLRK